MRAIAFTLSLVLIFMIPWEGMVRLSGFGNASKLFGLAVAGFWVMTVVINGRLRRPGLFHIMVCIFVVWNALSLLWSADIDRTMTHVMTWIQLLGMVFILWDLYMTRSALLAGLQAYILGAYVAIYSALSNFLAGEFFYSRFERFSSGETNPDGFAFIVVLGVPVAWYLASSRSTGRLSSLLKLVNYAYIPTAFVGLALSGTRTALIAAIPGMVFGLASLTRLRPWIRVAIFVPLIAAFIYLLPILEPMRSFQRLYTTKTEMLEGGLNQRVAIWQEGLASVPKHPILGVGSNMYRSVNYLGKVAHNSFISVLVEVGLIGFVIFAAILAFAVIRAWGQSDKWDARFWLTTLLVWAIGAFSLTWEHRKSTWLFLSLLIVNAALTHYRQEPGSPADRDEPEAQVLPDSNHHKLPATELQKTDFL
jgi:O-antigen ligase